MNIVDEFYLQSLWIRYGASGFVVACAKNMSLADIHCRLMPVVRPFLKEPLIQIEDQVGGIG